MFAIKCPNDGEDLTEPIQDNIDITSCDQETVEEPFCVPVQPPRKKTKSQVSDKCIEEAMEILKRPYPTLSTPDEWSVYGEHLANKLRKYSSRTSSIVQHRFNNILFEADMGNYDIVDNNIIQQPQYSNFHSYSTPSATFSRSSPLSSTVSPYYMPVTSLSPNESLHQYLSPAFQSHAIAEPYNDAESQSNSLS